MCLIHYIFWLLGFRANNLFVTSKNVTTNSPIHEFKVLPESLLKPLFYGVLFLALKSIFSGVFSF